MIKTVLFVLIISTSVKNCQCDKIQYLIFEGGGPDEGPGPNQTMNGMIK